MATRPKKAAKPRPNPRRRPAKEVNQPALPGADSPVNERVQDAAFGLIDRKADQRDAGLAAKEAMTKLLRIMAEEGITRYDHDKLHVRLKDEQKAKVKVDKEKKPKKKKGIA